MTAPNMVPTTAGEAEAAGFPVTVAVPYPDGPLTLTHPTWGAVQNYTVKGGRVEATSGDRLAALVGIGGTPLIRASTQGSGTPTPPDAGTPGAGTN